MSGWNSLPLGDALTAELPIARIKEAFDAEFATRDRPGDASVFARYESEGRLHCEVTVFFPPGARDLAFRFGARPCAAPVREGLELLCGDGACG